MEDRNLVRLVRNLQRRGERRRSDSVVCEGVRVVEEAVRAEATFEGVLVSPLLERTERGRNLLGVLEGKRTPIQRITDQDLEGLADTETPQGILAVVKMPDWKLDSIAAEKGRPVLVLDSVRDPGNVGTIIRTAFALGAAGLILLKGSARPNHPKVVRASAGSVFLLPIISLDDAEFAGWAEESGAEVWVADSEGELPEAPPQRLVVVVGNEGEGVRKEVRLPSFKTIAVPMARKIDSLNVAVATAILLHEVQRDS